MTDREKRYLLMKEWKRKGIGFLYSKRRPSKRHSRKGYTVIGGPTRITFDGPLDLGDDRTAEVKTWEFATLFDQDGKPIEGDTGYSYSGKEYIKKAFENMQQMGWELYPESNIKVHYITGTQPIKRRKRLFKN